ncbi:hypothetical protein ACQVP2_31810 [Methylobacterium aquaticum]|uniref:hypothetical protein n=1 Tax=Methylobacterium aquaticum TaxID=270351 RepID=UPI003D163DD0
MSTETLVLSHHAQQRLQQRAIPPLVVEYLEQFGSSMRCGGAERLFFDKESRRRLSRHVGGARGLRTIEQWLDVYVVVGDCGRIVTVAHRDRRFRRH